MLNLRMENKAAKAAKVAGRAKTATIDAATARARVAELQEALRRTVSTREDTDKKLAAARAAVDLERTKTLRLERARLVGEIEGLQEDLAAAEIAAKAAAELEGKAALEQEAVRLMAAYQALAPEIEAWAASAVPLRQRMDALHGERTRWTSRQTDYRRVHGVAAGEVNPEAAMRMNPGRAAALLGEVAQFLEKLRKTRAWLGDCATEREASDRDFRAHEARQPIPRRRIVELPNDNRDRYEETPDGLSRIVPAPRPSRRPRVLAKILDQRT